MRSPGDSSFPAISEPPTKMVPSTMPAGTGRLWVLPHCGSRPPPWVLPPVGPLTIESQVGEPLEGGDAQPQPLAQLARALRLGAVQPVGGGVTAPQPARAPPAPCHHCRTPPHPHPACWSSMAKARTVRTFPSTSSATPVALATCTERDEGHGEGSRWDRAAPGGRG